MIDRVVSVVAYRHTGTSGTDKASSKVKSNEKLNVKVTKHSESNKSFADEQSSKQAPR